MCGFVPMTNAIAILASSLSLSVIALDRYQNVMSALTTKWDPNPPSCIGMAFCLLFFCCGKFDFLLLLRKSVQAESLIKKKYIKLPKNSTKISTNNNSEML